MWKPLSLLFSFACIFVSHGQQKTISGSIKNVEGEPVPYANIVVNDTATASQPLTYGHSNEDGGFALQIPKNITNIVLNITALGYEEKSVPIQLDTARSLEIYMKTSVTSLKEVVVEARRTTDTLNLDIHNMNLTNDKTLRDMLNKTDGIIVSEEGGISYQGKQINKVFINGKEVFVNQNRVALDNLNYEIMEDVQIINNHKDKFTIDFNRIRDPVINIKTKPEFKGILKAELDMGYGFKNKYNINGKGFFFSDKLNAFVTSNTNNTGEIALTQKDVAAAVAKHATNSLSNLLYPFFIENFQTKKNFVSNNSLTLRREGENSKTGLVLYHGNINIERETAINTFIADTLVKASDLRKNDNGDFISATVNYNRKISENTVLENVLSAVGVKYREYTESMDLLFVPNLSILNIQTNDVPKSFTIANDLKITQLLSESTALDLDINYYYEKNLRDFETRLIGDITSNIFQQGQFDKNYFSALGKFKFRLKRGSLNAGIGVAQNNETGSLDFENNTNKDDALLRKVTTAQVPIALNGSFKKLDYILSVAPTLIHTKKSGNRGFLKMSHRLTYNFEAQNNLILELHRGNRFYHLNSLFDTIVRSYNHQIINHEVNIDGYSVMDEVSLSWFNTNVARSKRFHFAYEFRREQDFLQSILESVTNNVFYYANGVFDIRNTHMFNAGANKGFYFGSAYHRFDVGGDMNYTANYYPTIVNNLPARASSSSWAPTFNLGLRPRNFFVREMNSRLNWNYYTFNIDGEEVTRQSVLTKTLTVEGSRGKIDWEFEFEYQFYDVGQEKFSVPDSNLSIKYNYSDKLAFSLVGRSLLTLFELNNYNFVDTFSDGNTITQIATSNNLGYLLFNISYKF